MNCYSRSDWQAVIAEGRRQKAEVRGNNSNGLDDLECPNCLGDCYI
ncbi:MAG: hypothetical protein HC849_05470 [Oscillatoriales cyanobacterium RU_3_3]|nr:hypothetical protein [Microcoleus sp. SU_5_6]NJL66457.1 hypothetical protein [Microcoleus sp. SM1_3_4]NJM59761.1 hypothetical protein [Oscillatoriales cyanobacterium RU_3_3]NJR21461.1 hypothetical protein [Richelia sp. CSU_2_1]